MKIIKSDKLNKIVFGLDYDRVIKCADYHVTMDDDGFEIGARAAQKAIETNSNIYHTCHHICDVYVLAKSEEEAIGRFIIDETNKKCM